MSKPKANVPPPTPAWIPCPGGCGEFYCTRHRCHVCDCECPPIEDWTTDPYAVPKERIH